MDGAGNNSLNHRCDWSIFVVAIIASREHPYYSFVIFGGMLVGIIQSEWCYRKSEKKQIGAK